MEYNIKDLPFIYFLRFYYVTMFMQKTIYRKFIKFLVNILKNISAD